MHKVLLVISTVSFLFLEQRFYLRVLCALDICSLNGEANNICRIPGWKFIEIPDRLRRRWNKYVKTYHRQIVVRVGGA
jgi:hypothetical protein